MNSQQCDCGGLCSYDLPHGVETGYFDLNSTVRKDVTRFAYSCGIF
jgi:hypothetical protein